MHLSVIDLLFGIYYAVEIAITQHSPGQRR